MIRSSVPPGGNATAVGCYIHGRPRTFARFRPFITPGAVANACSLLQRVFLYRSSVNRMVTPQDVSRAAFGGDLQQVIAWLQEGHVDALDKTGCGLLHVATGGGQLHVAEELLQRGASVDLRCSGGGTALMSAAMQGQIAMVRLLLKHNASVDLQSDVGHTALGTAKMFCNNEVVQELQDAGAEA